MLLSAKTLLKMICFRGGAQNSLPRLRTTFAQSSGETGQLSGNGSSLRKNKLLNDHLKSCFNFQGVDYHTVHYHRTTKRLIILSEPPQKWAAPLTLLFVSHQVRTYCWGTSFSLTSQISSLAFGSGLSLKSRSRQRAMPSADIGACDSPESNESSDLESVSS